MDSIFRKHASMCLLIMALGCGHRYTVELPDNPVPPPQQSKLDAIPEVDHKLSPHPLYEFAFDLPSVEGETISSSALLGKVVLVDIWGTWCGPCRTEIPHLVQLQNAYEPQGLQVVGLTYEREGDKAEQVDRIRQFIDEQGINYLCLVGDRPTRKRVRDFQVYPTKLFLDRQGGVRLVIAGSQSYGTLEKVVLQLLEEDRSDLSAPFARSGKSLNVAAEQKAEEVGA